MGEVQDAIHESMTREYPPPVKEPCNECPWRRDAAAGHLGPYDAQEWVDIAHGESAIACHKTIVVEPGQDTGDWDHPQIRQCRGAAIFRANVCKTPRNPSKVTGPEDHDRVFGENEEFINHHTRRTK